MRNFRLISGSEILSFEKRDAYAKDLLEEIHKHDFISNRDHFVYAYHWVCLGYPVSARAHLLKIDLKYFTTDVFKDLYRALLAELLLRTDSAPSSELSREFEFFIVVKRSVKNFIELDLPDLTKQAIIDLANQFDSYSNF